MNLMKLNHHVTIVLDRSQTCDAVIDQVVDPLCLLGLVRSSITLGNLGFFVILGVSVVHHDTEALQDVCLIYLTNDFAHFSQAGALRSNDPCQTTDCETLLLQSFIYFLADLKLVVFGYALGAPRQE